MTKQRETCAIAQCDSPVRTRGWCIKHYDRWRRNGDPLHCIHEETILTRLQRLTAIGSTDDCWEWQGTLTPLGYSRLTWKGRQYFGHRMWYEEMVGPIPDGLQIDHLCRNRGCVNPDHLEAVTAKQNNQRKSHCPTCSCLDGER